jgi:hypothetical protein
VVGDSTTGYTSTFHGFYLPLQLVHVAASSGFIPSDQLDFRDALRLRGDEHKNLVPVDWVSAALVHLLLRPENHGKTYHLTNPLPVTTGSIEAAIAETVYPAGGAHPDTRSNGSLLPPQIEEFRKQMEVYSAYLSDDPQFDCSRTLAAIPHIPCPELDHAALIRLARYAIGANFGWPRRRPTPSELDVAALLEKLPKGETAGERALRLEVSGSCGGSWTIGFSRGIPTLVNSNGADISAYFNVHTMRRILQGDRSITKSLAEGRIILHASDNHISGGPALLEALFRWLQEAQ